MTQHFSGPVDYDESRRFQERYHEEFQLHGRSAPPPLENEPTSEYRRRLAERLQECAPNCKNFNLRQSTGTAFEALEHQIRADAQREAHNPTDIPEGTLKEVVRYDQAGRPSYYFFGRPSAWMNQFSYPPKKVAGIRNDVSFQKV